MIEAAKRARGFGKHAFVVTSRSYLSGGARAAVLDDLLAQFKRTGVECALYWDAQTDAFATSSSHSTTLISCGGVSVTTGSAISGTTTTARIGGGGNGSVSIFGFPLNYGDAASNSCVIVSVIKNSNMTTHINSYGYNTCNTSDLRRVERGVEVRY